MRITAEDARRISEKALVKFCEESMKRCLKLIKRSALKGGSRVVVYGIHKDVKSKLEDLGYTVVHQRDIPDNIEWMTVYEIIWGEGKNSDE